MTFFDTNIIIYKYYLNFDATHIIGHSFVGTNLISSQAVSYHKENYNGKLSSLNKKLDRVGPVYNRPSTDKLHHFVRKKNVTCDT